MKLLKKTLFIGAAVAALISVVSLTGCKSKEQQRAEAVNSVVDNLVDNLKGK